MVITLKPKKSLNNLDLKQSLASMAGLTGLKSLFLIGLEDGEFNFRLFSPWGTLDEVPLYRKLRVAEVLESPQADLPIVQDTVTSLFQGHQLVTSVPISQIQSVSTLSQTSTEMAPPFYKSWQFWAIVGGVVGGATLLYLASTTYSGNSRTSGITIRVE